MNSLFSQLFWSSKLDKIYNSKEKMQMSLRKICIKTKKETFFSPFLFVSFVLGMSDNTQL